MSARRIALVLAAVVAVYMGFVGWRGVLLIREGSLVAVVFGIAVVAIPLIGVWVLWRELRFGLGTQAMARQLAAEGGLPVDDLPRRPSGRPERQSADAAFAVRKSETEAEPENWRTWYRLAVAYDDAGDRRRGREAMRHAISLFPE